MVEEEEAPGIYLLTWTKIAPAESARCNYFGTLESLKGLKHSEEGLDGKFWLIPVNFSS